MSNKPDEMLMLKYSNGNYFAVPIDSEATVRDIKNKIQDKDGITPSYVHLYLNKNELSDDALISNQSIEYGQALEVVVTLSGGGCCGCRANCCPSCGCCDCLGGF